MKLAMVCLSPDPGHILPLIRIAAEARRDGHQAVYFVPDEAKSLVDRHGGNAHVFGPVLPSNSEILLEKISGRSSLELKLIYSRFFAIKYFIPLQLNALDRLEDIKSAVKSFDPQLIIGDEHLFGGAICAIAADCRVPVILHRAAGSNHKCQKSPPEAGKLWHLRQPVINLLCRAIASLESKFTKVFARSEWEIRNKQITVLYKYWSEFEEAKGTVSSLGTNVVTTGLGAIEANYLSGSIAICSDAQLLGPLPPLMEAAIPEPLLNWLELNDSRPIVLVCFGTMASLSCKETNIIIEAAAEMNVRLLWASRINPFVATVTPNSDVRWESWVPQPTVLSHRAVKGFLSHAGSGALQEALWFAKPVICVPHLWDQSYNAWIAEKIGFGVAINKNNISRKRLITALRLILHNDELRERARSLSIQVRNQNGSEKIRSIIRMAVLSKGGMRSESVQDKNNYNADCSPK